MPEKILCCSILKTEIEEILKGEAVEIHYLDSALHVDFDKMEGAVTMALDNLNTRELPVVIGLQCHPEMERLVAERGGRVIQAKNCIEMLLGDRLAGLDAESRSFYVTSGWLDNWCKIFVEGLHWDEIDARQNFGFYDRILVLDNGITPIDDEKIIEFFDYTQVQTVFPGSTGKYAAPWCPERSKLSHRLSGSTAGRFSPGGRYHLPGR